MNDPAETIASGAAADGANVLARRASPAAGDSERRGATERAGAAPPCRDAHEPARFQDEITTFKRYKSRAVALLGRTAAQGAVALADQVVVSGSRFATTIIVGRVCGPETLGNYTLAFTLLILVLGIQESLITVPYMIYGNRRSGEARAGLAGSVLIHSWMLGILTILCLFAAAGGVAVSGRLPGLASVLLTMASVCPFILLQEFCRRMALAHLRTQAAFAVDALTASIQLGGLAALVWMGRLSASSAFAALGAATAVAAGSWLWAVRSEFRFERARVLPELRRHWSFGRWVFGGSTISILYAFSVYWIVALVLGTKAAGLFAACQAVIMLSNPFLLGVSNVLGPWSAQAFARGGRREVRQVMERAVPIVVGAMSVFCVGAALLGEPFLEIVYGPEYVGHRFTISVLGLSALASSIGLVAHAGLCAVERPQVVFAANAAGLAIMFSVVGLFIPSLGLLGVATALLVGNVLGSAISFGLLWRLLHTADAKERGLP